MKKVIFFTFSLLVLPMSGMSEAMVTENKKNGVSEIIVLLADKKASKGLVVKWNQFRVLITKNTTVLNIKETFIGDQSKMHFFAKMDPCIATRYSPEFVNSTNVLEARFRYNTKFFILEGV
jgi:hypothetical protein